MEDGVLCLKGRVGDSWACLKGCHVGAGFSILSMALDIKRLGWVEDRKTGQALSPEVGAMCTCACYCKLEVLLGGTPGFSSKLENSWESNI